MELVQMLIFFAVSLGVAAGAFVWVEVTRRDQRRAVKRLSQESAKSKPEQPAERLFKEPDDFNLTVPVLPPEDPAGPESLSAPGDLVPPTPTVAAPSRPLMVRGREQLRGWLDRAALRVSPGGFLAVAAAAAVALAAAGWLIQGAPLAAAAFLVGGAAPCVYLRVRLHARREKLLRQLPPAFDLMARILRSGLSMPQSFQGVVEAFPNPLAAEFARCRDEQNLGVLPEVSYHGMAERTGVLEMKIFVMAMLIQRQTGGNLSEVLERLAGLIRERLHLRSQVRTLTAEGRTQAVVLLVLPVVMFFAMRWVNQPYTDILLAHPDWLTGMGLLMAVGALWIRKIIDIE